MEPSKTDKARTVTTEVVTLPVVDRPRATLKGGIELGLTTEDEIKAILSDPGSELAKKRIPEILGTVNKVLYARGMIQEAVKNGLVDEQIAAPVVAGRDLGKLMSFGATSLELVMLDQALKKSEVAGIDRDATIAAFKINQRGREIGFLTNEQIGAMAIGSPVELKNIVLIAKTIEVLNSLAQRFAPGAQLADETLKDIVDAYRGIVQMHSSGRLSDSERAECMELSMDQFIATGKDYALLLKTIKTFETMIPGYFTPLKFRQKALEMLAKAKTREEVMAANLHAL